MGLAAFVWLGLEDRLAPCPIVVVLNGDHPGRADEAAALYRDHPIRHVWLTSDPRSGDASDTGTASNAKRLVARGVPADAIRVVPGAATGTTAELRAVRSAAEAHRVSCVVAVTSAAHAARVRLAWSRLGGAPPRLLVRHAREAGYTGWRIYARELVLTVAALVGLPR